MVRETVLGVFSCMRATSEQFVVRSYLLIRYLLGFDVQRSWQLKTSFLCRGGWCMNVAGLEDQCKYTFWAGGIGCFGVMRLLGGGGNFVFSLSRQQLPFGDRAVISFQGTNDSTAMRLYGVEISEAIMARVDSTQACSGMRCSGMRCSEASS
jgi:hypothetical protein